MLQQGTGNGWADPEHVGHVAARLTIRAIRYAGKLLLIAPIILFLSLLARRIDPSIAVAHAVGVLYCYQVAIDAITAGATWWSDR